MQGYLGQPQRYIATQAPLEDTRGDFWRMIWEQQSRVVIMLTDLEEQGLVIIFRLFMIFMVVSSLSGKY